MSKNYFIAMSGNIGSGKTTAAKLLNRSLGLDLYDEPVVANRFLAKYYADMPRWSFTLQMEFLLKRIRHLEQIGQMTRSSVQDRTLHEDPEIFAKYLHGLGFLTDDELDLYFDYFHRLSKDVVQPDLVVHMHIGDVDTLMERIKERGRVEEQNIKREFLAGLEAYYTTFVQVCEHKYGLKVLQWDASKVDIRTPEGGELFVSKVKEALPGLN